MVGQVRNVTTHSALGWWCGLAMYCYGYISKDSASIGNTFSAMLKRKRITLEQAQVALTAYHQIPLRFTGIDISDALTYSERLGIYAYDAHTFPKQPGRNNAHCLH